MLCDVNSDPFDNIIEVDPVDSDNEGNEIVGIDPSLNDSKGVKAKKIQFDRINQFMRENDGLQLDIAPYRLLWTSLSEELNAIGPAFTEAEWKSKWSHHKYNKKRNRQASSDNQHENILETDDNDLEEDLPHHSIPTNYSIVEDVSSEIVQLLKTVVENQKIQMETQDKIIKQLDTFGDLLLDISKKGL